MAKKPTQKQIKLAQLISENLGSKNGTKSMQQMMLEAGYSANSARQQTSLIESPAITEALDPVVKAMIKERDAALKEMAKKRKKAKYADLTPAIDKLTKNIQLLSGKETERHAHSIDNLSDDELAKLINSDKS